MSGGGTLNSLGKALGALNENTTVFVCHDWALLGISSVAMIKQTEQRSNLVKPCSAGAIT
ncbi:hypothetical protein COLO4_08448 [Corchorus olitorius]|uniref:Uncharacterized protein n=1 Tax=Corchorus olitorius TaxID=93759 RepID=A0A1R3KFR2_9ROSI|nr:hypothetical protein COLO4_08448 [Corchorus olitorius]